MFIEEELAGAFDPDVPVVGLGLITHWAPGKFDDFSFHYDPLVPVLQTFDMSVGAVQGSSGTGTIQGGTLNSISAGIADIFVTDVGGVTDYRYKARLLNQYGASGNLVGLLFSYGASLSSRATQDLPGGGVLTDRPSLCAALYRRHSLSPGDRSAPRRKQPVVRCRSHS